MNPKIFPKSRVCVIDAYPAFVQGLKKALSFATKNNIQLNTNDGKKLIMGFCVESIETLYNTTNSSYPKVFCVGSKASNAKLENFIDKHFDKVMKHFPVPYCGKININSPDLEAAAASCLKTMPKQSKFKKLANFLHLRSVN
jgi:hypothetical protein